MAQRLTPEVVRADVAQLLHRDPEEAFDRENLFDCGLDSVRLMSLIERWRSAGVEVSFVELAEQPTLENWLTLLASRPQAALDA